MPCATGGREAAKPAVEARRDLRDHSSGCVFSVLVLGGVW